MSKKTIAFTMPPAAARPRERTPVDPDALAGEGGPFAAFDREDTGSDEWVRDRRARPPDDDSQTLDWPPALPSGGGPNLMIDLAAERGLMEVVSLSFVLPFALGWFWFVYAIRRRHRLWAA